MFVVWCPFCLWNLLWLPYFIFFNRWVEACFIIFDMLFIVLFAFLLLTGIGSWMFHMTLLYEMQLMDELPMVYACAVFVYCLYEVTLWSSREYVISMFRDKHSDCILYLWGYPLALKLRHWPMALKISLCPQQCVHGGEGMCTIRLLTLPGRYLA